MTTTKRKSKSITPTAPAPRLRRALAAVLSETASALAAEFKVPEARVRAWAKQALTLSEKQCFFCGNERTADGAPCACVQLLVTPVVPPAPAPVPTEEEEQLVLPASGVFEGATLKALVEWVRRGDCSRTQIVHSCECADCGEQVQTTAGSVFHTVQHRKLEKYQCGRLCPQCKRQRLNARTMTSNAVRPTPKAPVRDGAPRFNHVMATA